MHYLPWHVQRDVIEKLYHALNQTQRHEWHDLSILKEFLEDTLVTAYHVDGNAWIYDEFL